MISSTPNLIQFDPREIPWQYDLVRDIRRKFDYSLGTHECLLSGSVGSGKSLPVAHIIVTHCLLYPGSNFGIGRRTLPDLKDTLCKKIKQHMHETGIDAKYSEVHGDFELPNGSTITAFSWADGNYSKFGSYELSGFAMEEAQENKEPTAYEYILTRIGRLPHVSENIMLALANPDSPGHWLAKRFGIKKERPTGYVEHPSLERHVYYSRTEQNKFLPPSYIEGLKRNLDPKLARRLIYGEWVEINSERVYHSYDGDRNFVDADYVVTSSLPVRMSFDFNIAAGKPLSLIFFQHDGLNFHFFDEVIIEGQRTEDALEEAAARGLLDYPTKYIVHGDATGDHMDTRSKRSDYDIIKKFLANFRRKDGGAMTFEIQVPRVNPPIRSRHNLVNAQCENDLGQVRLFVYRRCKILDEGMRLTALKPGAQYIEDDSKHYQHCTTALGYGIHAVDMWTNRKRSGSVQL